MVQNREEFSLREFQREVAEWSTKNFGDGPYWHKMLGVVEEVGELAHAFLKLEQGIRGSEGKHIEDAQDAIGDIFVYMADLCSRRGWDMTDLVQTTWLRVSKRDWKKHPTSGGESV